MADITTTTYMAKIYLDNFEIYVTALIPKWRCKPGNMAVTVFQMSKNLMETRWMIGRSPDDRTNKRFVHRTIGRTIKYSQRRSIGRAYHSHTPDHRTYKLMRRTLGGNIKFLRRTIGRY